MSHRDTEHLRVLTQTSGEIAWLWWRQSSLRSDTALVARLRGTWVPAGGVRLIRAGLPINVLAVAWLAFETVNIAWPRSSLAPPGAPAYQLWAAPIVLAVIGVAGLSYLLVAKPHRRIGNT